MADYRTIEGCTPKVTVARHRSSRTWLGAELAKPGSPGDRVVVSHHYPRKRSTAPQYQEDLCTAAFGSELPAELLD